LRAIGPLDTSLRWYDKKSDYSSILKMRGALRATTGIYIDFVEFSTFVIPA
jgi:hypothetical protein